MTLRIDRVGERVRLSGELRSEYVCQVKAEIDQCGPRRVLDLEEVDRVDGEAFALRIRARRRKYQF
jgi:ABC-type transporter Mla MlaB component